MFTVWTEKHLVLSIKQNTNIVYNLFISDHIFCSYPNSVVVPIV